MPLHDRKSIWSPKYLFISSISVRRTSLSPLWSVYNRCISTDVHNRSMSSSMELMTVWKASSLRAGFCGILADSTDFGAMKAGLQFVWYRASAAYKSLIAPNTLCATAWAHLSPRSLHLVNIASFSDLALCPGSTVRHQETLLHLLGFLGSLNSLHISPQNMHWVWNENVALILVLFIGGGSLDERALDFMNLFIFSLDVYEDTHALWQDIVWFLSVSMANCSSDGSSSPRALLAFIIDQMRS